MNISPHGIVTLYPKIILHDKVIIHSQDCTRSTRRNDFTVSFTDPERPSNLRYGKIQKFLSYPANSAESIYVAIIQELEIHRCTELESLQFPPEIQSLSHLLCSDFFLETTKLLYLLNTFCPNALMFLVLVYPSSPPWSVTQRF